MSGQDSTPSGQQQCSGGVVLLHEYARTARSFRKLEMALQGARFATLNLHYQSLKKPIEGLAADIDSDIAGFAAVIDGPIHFVGHSMGGLLTRVYLARHRPARLGRVVMLGTPNGGSEVADVAQRLAIYRAFCGPAGLQLSTELNPALRSLPPVDYALGIIAGNRTIDPISSFLIFAATERWQGFGPTHPARWHGGPHHRRGIALRPGPSPRGDRTDDRVSARWPVRARPGVCRETTSASMPRQNDHTWLMNPR